MKRLLPSGLLSLMLLGSAFAAPKATSSRAQDTLAHALLAVSPDPLGGKLGLGLATQIAAPKPTATPVVATPRATTGSSTSARSIDRSMARAAAKP